MFGKKKEKKIDMPINGQDQKKEKRDNAHKSTAASNTSQGGYGYDVELYDVWDTTSRRLPVFGANRIIEGENIYLYNEKNGFKVPFPENSEEYKNYKLEELDDLIKEVEKNIKSVSSGKKNWSLKDLKKEHRIYKNYKRSIELQGRGSYMILNSNGRPLFMFDRVGNLKMPLFKNVDRSLIYTPTEQKTQEVSNLLKENQEKNGQEKLLKLSNYAFLVILGLMVAFSFYMGYKMMNLPTEITTTLADTTNMLANVAKDLNNVSSSISNIAPSSISPDAIVKPNLQVVTGR